MERRRLAAGGVGRRDAARPAAGTAALHYFERTRFTSTAIAPATIRINPTHNNS